MNSTIKIALCDDHVVFRKGLMLLLSNESDLEVIAEYSDGESLIQNIANLQADIILLDINMNGRNGIESLKQINAIRNDLKVIMLSMNPPDLYGVRSLKSGAYGYLQKTVTEFELIDAVRRVANGKKHLSDEMIDLLLLHKQQDANLLDELTDRELEILTLYARKLGNKAISEILNLSPKTISTHKQNLLKKLGASSIEDAVKHIKTT